jgi:hypothetical protein
LQSESVIAGDEEVSTVAGPIEFASDRPVDDKGPTEYGGRAGLIQTSIDGNGRVHEPSPSEVRGMIVRGEAPLKVDDATGMLTKDETAQPYDRLTGDEIDPVWYEDAGARPVEAPPRTGDPKAAEL